MNDNKNMDNTIQAGSMNANYLWKICGFPQATDFLPIQYLISVFIFQLPEPSILLHDIII